MLQSVRKYTQGWVATMMGIILSFAFILWGIENYVSGSAKKTVAAKVNGKAITISQVDGDFQRMMMNLKDQMGSTFNLPPQIQQQAKAQALYNLIMQNVLSQAAAGAGFRITMQETVAMIRQMPAFQEAGNFSKERFLQITSKMGYTKEAFINDVSQTLLLNQVASGIIGSGFVLPNELNQALSLSEQKRDIEYAVIQSSQFKNNHQITPEKMNAFYQQHTQQFNIPAKVQIEYVQLSVDDLKPSIKITEQDYNDYFNSNNDLNRNNPKVKEKAREYIQQQKLEQAFLGASDKLTDLAYTNPTSLIDAANNLGLKVQTSEYFTPSGGNTALTKNPKIIAAAFNSDILKDHTNSNLIEISSGNVVIIRVKDYQAESIAPFGEVKDKIKTQLIEAESKVKAKEKGEAILAKIQSKNEFKAVIAAEHLSSISKPHISRQDKNISPEILQMAFNYGVNAKKPAIGAQLHNGDYVVLILNNSVNLDVAKATSQQRTNMEKMYPTSYGKLEYDLYTEHQMQTAKIKTYVSQ